MGRSKDSMSVLREFKFNNRPHQYYSLKAAEENGAGPVMSLPRSLKVLYENMLRHEDGLAVTREHLTSFCEAVRAKHFDQEVFFHPTRILMNDSAGIPLMADLAALRAAVARNGGDPDRINPQIPADMVVDHSVMVDAYGTAQAFEDNLDIEFSRNAERYKFLRWAQQSFSNFRVVPPGTGICHQVNVEFLARGIWTAEAGDTVLVYPETLLGTDSHTPMINSLGIMGWGVGGIEGGAAMLGQPITMALPRVVGCRLVGRLQPGVTATDLVLTLTQRLREYKVVAAFVEYFGPGLASLAFSDRATVSNMAPEYGATMGFFPVDAQTLQYLAQTARGESNELIEHYARMQGLWHDPDEPQPSYDEVLEVDLSEIVPCIAGPRRPQDRIALSEAAARFDEDVYKNAPALPNGVVPVAGHEWTMDHGHVVIASITSCTNTSNPSNMLAAGLLARNALRLGLASKPWVKTSLAPGSRVVMDYLAAAKVQDSLDELGFNLVGFGCATCMGNSGPLDSHIAQAIENSEIVTTAVLSGNRNFEGRIHPLVKANYICSPPLVVAYALAGTSRIDFENDPLGTSPDGKPVFLADIWPDALEVAELVNTALDPERFRERYKNVFEGDARWNALHVASTDTFQWEPTSLYMKQPPFFDDLTPELPERKTLEGARALLVLGDSITTDHISPVGTITASSSAGQYLRSLGIEPADFNSFAARRVNHDVMLRGAFANIRIRNEMADGREGGWTRHRPDGEVMSVHEAAARYKEEGVPLIVIAGKDYGAGSSRDWAAKGTQLLGIRAIIAESFERIHRSNLIGMGVLPLQLPQGVTWATLGLDGSETFDIANVEEIVPRSTKVCTITRVDGTQASVELLCRLDTPLEAAYYEHGGILHYIARHMLEPA
ncbi:aconitate hydratase AcnA [Pollutimonas nitritireducens]|uniref:Aconitate hydratase n=1 Tax=Pollutimonas nitritireducens TaxID=2045209 RepID=A0A2N4UCC9_9BURK|nr:aconitate hydratase AcnA [Pollutimonas nitritireducens]PLC52653.1 aconitate hydratase AcnA [Pollutimonas nitritireducens]